MELRAFAERILSSPTLEAKLGPPPGELTDDQPGEVLRMERPARPDELRIRAGRDVPVPPREGMHDPAQCARIVHALANHELQAVELFAWALLAFPDAPPEFRRGLLDVLREEQIHTKMYIARLEEFDARPGDFPVSGYFWNKIRDVHTPRQFVCTMSLIFENSNLDHTVEYARAARKHGHDRLAATIDRIHDDEARHVSFGWKWLERFKDPEESMWEAFRSSLTWPLRPGLARGEVFHAEGRIAAGLEPEFIRLLAESKPGRAPEDEIPDSELDR